MPEWQAVALDVDGTLTNNDDRVTPRTRAAVQAVAARGVPLVLATGRALDGAELVLDDLGLDMGLILVNGALLYDGRAQEPFARRMVSPEVARETIAAIEAEGQHPFIYDDPLHSEWIAMANHGAELPRMPRFIRSQPERHHRTELGDWLNHDTLVVVAGGPREPLERLTAHLSASLAGRASVDCTLYPPDDLWILTVIGLGCNKWDGLRTWCARHGLDPRQVMAIGDGHNDRAMLANCGWGVAMGQADPAVKAIADEIVADNEHDGVAEALERHLLH